MALINNRIPRPKCPGGETTFLLSAPLATALKVSLLPFYPKTEVAFRLLDQALVSQTWFVNLKGPFHPYIPHIHALLTALQVHAGGENPAL